MLIPDLLIRPTDDDMNRLRALLKAGGPDVLEYVLPRIGREHREVLIRFAALFIMGDQPTEEERAEMEEAFARNSEGPFYHGGVGGLQPGDMVLPPAETGADPRGEGEVYGRAAFVYFATVWRHAAIYARRCPGGQVYLIEPEGQITGDPLVARCTVLTRRYLRTPPTEKVYEDALCAPRARVVAVAPTPPPTPAERLMAALSAGRA